MTREPHENPNPAGRARPAAFPRLDADATARALAWPALVDALRAMLVRKRDGATHSPERLSVALPGGTLLAMPAADGEYAVVKTVTVHPGNPARGLASILGEVLLMRADTGERVLLLDGPAVTARRTAAISALAARTLAPGASGPLLVVGTGVQARAHVEAFHAVLGVTRAFVASRDPARADALARHARALGVDAQAIASPDERVAEAAFVVTATTATRPVLADRVRDDAFVAAVGAFRPEMCELPSSLVRRAALFVDDAGGALLEAGDLLQAGIDWDSVVPLERALDAPVPRAGRPVVFKSVGQALWDLAAARLAFESLAA